MNLLIPVNGEFTITSPFGIRGKEFHNGIDLATPLMTPLYAIDDGRAVFDIDPQGGKYIQLNTSYGYWHFVHLDEVTVTDKEVKRGELIGFTGNTGNSTGPHLHIGCYDKEYGNWIDPTARINELNRLYFLENNFMEDAIFDSTFAPEIAPFEWGIVYNGDYKHGRALLISNISDEDAEVAIYCDNELVREVTIAPYTMYNDWYPGHFGLFRVVSKDEKALQVERQYFNYKTE